MSRRTSLGIGLLVLLFLSLGNAGKKPAPNAELLEFPVYLQQKVTAGITPVGTRVAAKLTIATLVQGKVVPQGAVLTGEVTESQAKSADSPSKLGIRVVLAEWKGGSLPIKAYLTEWYYPPRRPLTEDDNSALSAIHGSVGITIGGGTPYPPSASPGASRFPDDEPPTSSPRIDPHPDNTTANVSPHRVRMRDVETTRSDDGSISLVCKKRSLKLDKGTIYALASYTLSASE
jgi:hypothetical protein